MLPIILMIVGFLLTPWFFAVLAGATPRRSWMTHWIAVGFVVGLLCDVVAGLIYFKANGPSLNAFLATTLPMTLSVLMGYILGTISVRKQRA